MRFEDVLSKFGKVEKTANGYKAMCPCHADKSPSLSISQGEDGKTLINCFAGCQTSDICTAVGITVQDLFPDTNKKPNIIEQREHIYTSENGEPVAKKVIKKLDNGGKKCAWYRYDKSGIYKYGLEGFKPPLYNLPGIIKESDTVYVVEGEKDAETLLKMGLTATTSPNGGGAAWSKKYNDTIQGKNIVVISDNDETGKKYAKTVINSLLGVAKSLKEIDPCTIYKGLKEKGDITDISDIIGIDETKKRLIEAVLSADIITKKEKKVNNSNVFELQKPYLTADTLAEYFEENNIIIRKNLITKQLDIKGFENENREFLNSNIVALVKQRIQEDYQKVTTESVEDSISIIASRNTFNPVIEFLNKYEWDGRDRIGDLIKLMHIECDDLSVQLVVRWLYQCIIMLYNSFDSPFGAEGVLILQGKPAVGKTSLLRALALANIGNYDFFREGQSIDFRDKDTYIRAVSCWISELGEIESTLKSDTEKLKAFITQPIDTYRKPYGRSDETSLRRTSFAGTCNGTQVLVDPTGNRRYWVVPIPEPIIYKDIEKFDFVQLWRQIQTDVEKDLNDIEKTQAKFRLSSEILQQLNERNGNFEKPLPAQAEISDILTAEAPNGFERKKKYMTVSEFMERNDILRRYSAETVGRALEKLGIIQETKRIDGVPRKCRLLPYNEFKGATK